MQGKRWALNSKWPKYGGIGLQYVCHQLPWSEGYLGIWMKVRISVPRAQAVAFSVWGTFGSQQARSPNTHRWVPTRLPAGSASKHDLYHRHSLVVSHPKKAFTINPEWEFTVTLSLSADPSIPVSGERWCAGIQLGHGGPSLLRGGMEVLVGQSKAEQRDTRAVSLRTPPCPELALVDTGKSSISENWIGHSEALASPLPWKWSGKQSQMRLVKHGETYPWGLRPCRATWDLLV